ncbi:MAG: pyrroloquinoline quinone biosynthesis protein PqqB [Rhizobiaceae bacterium]|nr:pyrroloquinoline quinone biosynthesis protein PqqB [Rhizobiaceae bacterium]
MKKHLRALVLGAAAGGGLPQWNCGCENCVAARDPSNPLMPQSQSSLAITVDGNEWAILNASPDIRTQLQDNPPLHPKSRRDTPIRSILLTNGDIDHVAGLLILREKQPFRVYLTGEILNVIEANPIFQALDRSLVNFEVVGLDQPFDILPGLTSELFAVPGKVPLYMEEGEVVTDLEGEQTVGVRLASGNERMWYIPGCAKLTPKICDSLKGEKTVLFDGTVFENDEMLQAKVGQKTGARMGHMAMSGDAGSIAGLADLDISRKIYVHINNTNPVWRHDTKERLVVENAGWEIAFDGMEIEA